MWWPPSQIERGGEGGGQLRTAVRKWGRGGGHSQALLRAGVFCSENPKSSRPRKEETLIPLFSVLGALSQLQHCRQGICVAVMTPPTSLPSLSSAAYNEMQVGETALSQLQHCSLGTCLALAVGVVWASMTPILKGVKQEAFGEGTEEKG